MKLQATKEFSEFLETHSWISFGLCDQDIVIAISRDDRKVSAIHTSFQILLGYAVEPSDDEWWN